MADVTRAPRIKSITMEVFPGTERAAAFDHAISLAVAHRADVVFTHEHIDYGVDRRKLHDLVLQGRATRRESPQAPPPPPENEQRKVGA